MKVVVFGSYVAGYSRTHVLLTGLKRNRVSIVECNDTTGNPVLRYLNLVRKFITINGGSTDIIFVAFPTHFDVPLAWLLGKIYNKKVIFDSFVSRYNTYILDRRYYASNSWQAKVWFAMDWLNCRLADVILLDTNTHIKYFIKTFHAPAEKFRRVLVGTDEKIFYPRKASKNHRISVGFHGSYLPLQGVPVIIETAKYLPDKQFNLLGKGPDYKKCKEMVKSLQLHNVKFLKSVSYSDLPKFICQQDIYLGGPFGTNKKAELVIPNKVYESLAMGKPTIVGDSLAIRELLTDKKDCYIVKRGDAKDLVLAIKTLGKDNELRKNIARNGRSLFLNYLTSRHIGKLVSDILKTIIHNEI